MGWIDATPARVHDDDQKAKLAQPNLTRRELVTLAAAGTAAAAVGSLAYLQEAAEAGPSVQPGDVAQPKTGLAETVIGGWPAKPQEAAKAMIAKYGQPNEMTASHPIWYKNGPWKETIVSRDEIPHNFPMPHTDMLEQIIDYRVPPDKFDDLAQYDGSVIVERTKGTMSARCDKEEMNLLALNLANDIATGKRSVEDARQFYATTAKAFKDGQKPPYTQRFQFTVASGGTADPDRQIIS